MIGLVGAWPAASKTNASWPAHQLGRAGEVVYCREEKWKPERLLSAFSQRVPRHVPSPPSRWAGRYGPFNVRAAGQVTSEKYNLPPHNPTREGESRGKNLFPLGVLSPISSQEMGPRPGRPRFPAVPTAWGQNHKGTPPGRAKFPPVPTALKKRPASAGKTPDRI